MTSMFDMNATQRCQFCMDAHSPTTKCSTDILKHYVKELREEATFLRGAAKEALKTAEEFQAIIRSIEPELTRLVAVELHYKKLVGDVYGGTEELQAETQTDEQLSFPEL